MIDYLNPDFSDTPGSRAPSKVYKLESPNIGQVDISVITPFYNTEYFFVETFISLQAQSLQNWEWIIVDDGSDDRDSISMLKEIAAKDSRIKVIRQKNSGPAAARNEGVRNSKGRYICLLDSDDMIEPTYLEKCIWFLDSYPEFGFCNSYTVIFGEQESLWTRGFETGKTHLHENSGPPISVIRRYAYEKCGGFDESIVFGHEDWDFWLALAKAGFWGYTIREFLQWYRKRQSGRFEQIMKAKGADEKFKKFIGRKYSSLSEYFPEPSRPPSTPYEVINTEINLTNSFLSNPTGRSILFLVPWMVVGGADRVNLDLIEGLVERGHNITVCATLDADHRWMHEFAKYTPDIFILPNILKPSDYPRFLTYLIQSRKIDTVVIAGSTLGYQLLPYLRAVLPNVVFVDMCHVEEMHWLNGGHPRFGVGYQEQLDLNITTTKNLSTWMHSRGADISRIRVLYTGVRSIESSVDERYQVRNELCIPVDIPLIIFAGRICEQKRPELLVKILKEVKDRGIAFKALVIGNGELKSRLESVIDEYHLAEHVKTLGAVSHNRWLEILASSDIILMPSRYEGISIALLEAIAAGVVPVVARVGGQDEIISEGMGFLIPQNDDELKEYVKALSCLLTNSSKLEAMSNECESIANSRLSWDKMIDNFLEILNEVDALRLKSPRKPVSPELGIELATLALECKRLGDSLDWLWSAKPKSSTVTISSELIISPTEAQAVARLAVEMSQTWLGRKLIRNKFLRALGQRFSRRFGESSLT